MKKLLAVLKKVLHPPKLVLLIVSAVVFSALILIFLTERLNSAAAYPIFVLSAYCLTILLLPLPKLIRNAKTGISICISRVPFVRRYMDDISFRGSVGIYQGAAVNFKKISKLLSVIRNIKAVTVMLFSLYHKI